MISCLLGSGRLTVHTNLVCSRLSVVRDKRKKEGEQERKLPRAWNRIIQIRHENVAFPKHSLNPAEGFENGVFQKPHNNHVIFLTEFSSNTNSK